MPKKSDRKEHESAMSSLLPEVSLDEDRQEEEPGEQTSSTELQNSSTTDTENYRSDSSSERERSKNIQDRGPGLKPNDLSPLPNERPNLERKLGPYVSNDVDGALEDVYLLLRRRFGGDASKSLIVEAALRLILSDYLRRGDESEIVKWMDQLLEESSS